MKQFVLPSERAVSPKTFASSALSLAAVGGVIGPPVYVAVALLHPSGIANDHHATFRRYAMSQTRITIHLVQLAALAVSLVGIAGLAASILQLQDKGRLPAPGLIEPGNDGAEAAQWTEEAGFTRWYLYDLQTERIGEEPSEIVNLIRSAPYTQRHRSVPMRLFLRFGQKSKSTPRTPVSKRCRPQLVSRQFSRPGWRFPNSGGVNEGAK